MANYNTFHLYDCNLRKTILVSSSVRKCLRGLHTGRRIDVWNNNKLVEKIYCKNKEHVNKYVKLEKQYIGEKQRIAHLKKERRRKRADERLRSLKEKEVGYKYGKDREKKCL